MLASKQLSGPPAIPEIGGRRAWRGSSGLDGGCRQCASPGPEGPVAREARAAPATPSDSDLASTQFVESEWETSEAGSPVAGPSLPTASSGSALHRTGGCQPCAWYWKPVGCLKGLECLYCHMCPQGELKHRRKEKVALIRKGLATPQGRLKRGERERELEGFKVTVKNTFIHVELPPCEEAMHPAYQRADILTTAGLVFAFCRL